MSGGRGEDSIPLGKDNQDLGMTHFIVTDGGKRGDDLKKMVDEYRELILQTLKAAPLIDKTVDWTLRPNKFFEPPTLGSLV